jgi:transcription antitermination factor NusG
MVLTDIPAKTGGIASVLGTWGVVRTRGSAEDAVADRLAKIGANVYLPRVSVRIVRKGKAVTERRAIYPTYVFAAWETEYDRHEVRRTRDVLDILPVHERDQARLVRDLSSLEATLAVDDCLDVDDWARAGVLVEVVAGPLTGVMGKVSKRRNRDVLEVGVLMFNQAVTVTIDVKNCRPI